MNSPSIQRWLTLCLALFTFSVLGACSDDPEPTDPTPECTADAECDDGDDTTADTCVEDACVNTFIGEPGCTEDAECDDMDDTTDDACIGGACVNTPIGEPDCTEDADCDDMDDATADTCVDGACVNTPIVEPPACAEDADCNDDNPCTADTCMMDGDNASCENAVIESCCEADGDCDDADACTLNGCNLDTNTCNSPTELPDCCTVDDDCPDSGDICSVSGCDVTSNTCEETSVEGCCIDDGDCDDNNPATSDSCVDNSCAFETIAVLGCTNPIASNYDPNATEDDGSCEIPEGCFSDVCFTFGDYDEATSTLPILYEASVPFAGFEMKVVDSSLAEGEGVMDSVAGGVADDFGWSLSNNALKLLGFSLTLSLVPPGTGVLVNLTLKEQFTGGELCMEGIVVSSEGGVALTNQGECGDF